MEETQVVDIVVEVHVGTRHGVVKKEPSRLRDSIFVILGLHRTNRERCLEQHLCGVVREARVLNDLGLRNALVVVRQVLQNAKLYHQARDLKYHGCKGNLLCEALCLEGCLMLLAIDLFELLCELHIFLF